MNIAKILILSGGMALLSCNNADTTKKQATPEKLNDGWVVASPEAVGLKQELMAQAMVKAADNKKLDALVVVRNGKLVAEYYANGYSHDKLHKVWSITKAITASITGIAIDQGKIASDTAKMYQYMEGYSISDSSVREISIAHLLSMTSGFEWVELGGPGTSNFELPYSSDWIAYTLQQPHGEPGKEFVYNTGSYMFFAPIIKNATDMQADEFAKAHLFTPLGISIYQWDKQSEFWTKTKGDELKGAREPGEIKYTEEFAAYTNTGSGLHMLPRDLAKIGQLYLDKGKWKGAQILSEEWIKKATREQISGSAYGYGWKLRTYELNGRKYDAWYASGFGQQAIIVIPSLQFVVVYLQHHYDTMAEGEQIMNEQMAQFISAAAK